MHRLYPESNPHLEEMLTTSDGQHRLWVALYGNPQGLPVICLHGGPGAGTSPLMHRFFDPEIYHILCFDQRGCGQSTPSGSLRDNTTEKLLNDIDQLRMHYGFSRYALFGGSWGATLALLYAYREPSHCLGIVLRGIFLNTENNLHWLYGDGASSMFPAAWADFTAPINHSLGSINDVLTAYAKLLHAEDEFTRLQAARAWNLWEYRLSVADSQATQDRKTRPSNELSTAQIEHHYLSQYCFFDPKLFDRPNAELDAIPIYLLHGANDYVCPLGNATHLKALFPQIKLEILEDAGHCAFSPKMAEGLCGATRRLAGLYGH